MTIEDTLSVTKTAAFIIGPTAIFVAGYIINFQIEQSKRVNSLEKDCVSYRGRIDAEEILTAHLVHAGENIKGQLFQHELMINEMRVDLKYLKETQAEILSILKSR